MRIDELSVQNFVGIGAVTIAPKEPVVVVAGANGAGKTSLYQAIRLGLLGDVPRIDLMRDAPFLVKAGADRGLVQITFANGAWSGVRSVTLPDRKAIGADFPTGGLRWSLEPAAFAKLENKERMKVVLALSKAGMKREAIEDRLRAHGIDEAVIAELVPQLVLGFESCAEIAKTKAAENRGGWRATTGETYGSKKADGWKAPAAGALPDAPSSIEEAEDAEQKARELCAELVAKAEAAKTAQANRTRDAVLAQRVQPLRGLIDSLEVAAGAVEEHPYHNVTCPHCNGVFPLDDEFKAVTLPDAPKGAARVKPAQKAKAKAELAKAKADLAAADAAAARAADPTPLPTPPSDEEIGEAMHKRDTAIDLTRTLRSQRAAYDEALKARSQVADREQRAALLHSRVQAWEKAEVALSPGGIPSELMAAALGPLRAALREVCASPAVVEWPLPELTEDGSITGWGRPYALLSRSEQYRVDLLLTAALAVVSGTRILVADEADILEPAARGELQNWLLDMTEPQDESPAPLEAAWIFLTLKGIPAPAEGVSRFWIADGSA